MRACASFDMLDPRTFERDGRVVVDIKKIRPAQIGIPLVIAGVQTGGVDFNLHTGAGRVLLIHVDRTGEALELSTDGRNHHVASRELDGGVVRINLPGQASLLCYSVVISGDRAIFA